MRFVGCDRGARGARSAGSRVRRGALAGLVISALVEMPGCAGASYAPGSLLAESTCGPTARATAAVRRVGCLDVRIALACNPAVAPERPLVAFSFGNRCGSAARVDFGGMRVTARDADGAAVPVAAFDPRSEIHAGTLGAGAQGREVIEYDPVTPSAQQAGRVSALCFDLTSLSDAVADVPVACLSFSERPCVAGR